MILASNLGTARSIVEKEARVRQLQLEVLRKSAYIQGLPEVEISQIDEPPLRFVRLANPKEQGKSLKKKQCDLWEFCWGSSSLLAYIVVNTFDWTGQNTIELGGGLGLSTLAIAKAFKTKRSVMTDLVADALKVFELSTTVETLQGSTETRVLNWNKPEEGCEDGAFDLVLGSDVLFMSWCARPVANVATRCLAQDGIILIADPYRLNDESFLQVLSELGVVSQATYEFPAALIEQLVSPLLDTNGSIVPVKRAKLLVASRRNLDGLPLDHILVSKLGLVRLS
jgi:predicted nicotinamide N-methyase